MTASIGANRKAAMCEYFTHNSHGDTTGFDGDEYDYDAFGNQIDTNTEATYNPFRYCGEYFDEETGFVYLRARYYDPSTQRFVTEDTHWNLDNMIYGDRTFGKDETPVPNPAAVVQSGNLYAYCMGNPVNHWDPTGLTDYPESVYTMSTEQFLEFKKDSKKDTENYMESKNSILSNADGIFGIIGGWIGNIHSGIKAILPNISKAENDAIEATNDAMIDLYDTYGSKNVTFTVYLLHGESTYEIKIEVFDTDAAKVVANMHQDLHQQAAYCLYMDNAEKNYSSYALNYRNGDYSYER